MSDGPLSQLWQWSSLKLQPRRLEQFLHNDVKVNPSSRFVVVQVGFIQKWKEVKQRLKICAGNHLDNEKGISSCCGRSLVALIMPMTAAIFNRSVVLLRTLAVALLEIRVGERHKDADVLSWCVLSISNVVFWHEGIFCPSSFWYALAYNIAAVQSQDMKIKINLFAFLIILLSVRTGKYCFFLIKPLWDSILRRDSCSWVYSCYVLAIQWHFWKDVLPSLNEKPSAVSSGIFKN